MLVLEEKEGRQPLLRMYQDITCQEHADSGCWNGGWSSVMVAVLEKRVFVSAFVSSGSSSAVALRV